MQMTRFREGNVSFLYPRKIFSNPIEKLYREAIYSGYDISEADIKEDKGNATVSVDRSSLLHTVVASETASRIRNNPECG